VLISADDNPHPRLLRVPVDQQVTVIRAQPAHEAKFVRASRVAKSSGARIAVLDLTHPESEIEPRDKAHYATLCVPHHAIRFHVSVSTANAQVSHPEVWCTDCAQSVRDRDHYRVYGPPSQATA
jgi:hypothetical protein